MVALREAGRTDVLGVLGRALFETHLVSLYVLLKGRDLDDDAVLHELAADHFKWQKRMVKTAKLPERVAANVEEWEGILRKLEKKIVSYVVEVAFQAQVDHPGLVLRDRCPYFAPRPRAPSVQVGIRTTPLGSRLHAVNARRSLVRPGQCVRPWASRRPSRIFTTASCCLGRAARCAGCGE